ncbi:MULTISPECIES: hypothetical protein [unclassified Leptolyngbya]|uniref:hypothetical protein n=1 Tax=unclassified Leptolyngbya TaxID=2650499 RepID=UPI001681E377|nr:MULTISPECIES: hypothetical protein [unclassified Leptolyngbya]MBD1913720.1 hypothetical protein [Leptolyngbya sp. FACHB-8]MBD2155316.1 hypothetical protein [Leptolyngbya sp. FACHB-16]
MRRFVVGFAWFLVFYGMVGLLGGAGGVEPSHSFASPSVQDASVAAVTLTTPTPHSSIALGILLLVASATLSAIGTLTGSLPGTSEFASLRGERWGDR